MADERTGGRCFLITNDDGIDAPGIAALERAAEGFGRAVVVAPSGPWSGRGHAVTTHEPIRVHRLGEGRYAVDGTPADCVRVGLHRLCPEADTILAGINAGGNLGTDVHHSGTVAAAREGVIHARQAIALSHYIARGRTVDWEAAIVRARAVLRWLDDREWTSGTVWNVNLPHPADDAPVPEIVECPLDPSPLPLDFDWDGDTALYRGNYQARLRVDGGDVATCFGGRISVSRLPLVPALGLIGDLAFPTGRPS